MPRSNKRSLVLIVALTVVFLVEGSFEIQAHKAITSRYSYNNDVFAILRDNCGRCHVEGGPAPMGLMTWNDGPNSATPWAESIKQSVIGEQMPPWYVDPKGPAIRGGFGLSASQSDKLLTWAIGGTPEGDLEKKPEKVSYQARWSGGPPDLKLQMDREYVMGPDTTEATVEFVIPTGLTEQRWLKAVDLLPGSPEIVRNASISLQSGAILTEWVPGDNLVSAPAGTAFRLPAGSNLRLQIHYKKQWQNEGKTLRDRSTIGLYFTARPASGREIQSTAVSPPSGLLSVKGRVVAVRPSLDQVYGTLVVQAISPAGARVSLLRLRAPRPEWRRRYWLAQPVDLPAGSRIEVTMTPASSYIDLSGAKFMKAYSLQVAVDFVPGM